MDVSDYCTSTTPELRHPLDFAGSVPPSVTLTRGDDGTVTRVTVAVDGTAVAKAAMLSRPLSHLPQHVMLASDALGDGGCSTAQAVKVNQQPAALSGVTVVREPDTGAAALSAANTPCVSKFTRSARCTNYDLFGQSRHAVLYQVRSLLAGTVIAACRVDGQVLCFPCASLWLSFADDALHRGFEAP